MILKKSVGRKFSKMSKLYIIIIHIKDLIQCHRAGLRWSSYLFLLINKNRTRNVRFKKKVMTISHWFWFIHGVKELFTDQTYFFQSTKEKPLIIDCGSNIGLSVLYFKQLYPNSEIICFEPDKAIFNLLIDNLNTFQIQGIRCENAAVWNSNGFINFNSDGHVGGKIDETQNGKLTKSIRLRDFLVSTVDFLKIDIEGAEYELLIDCKDVLHCVENIFIEYHSQPDEPQKLDEILGILRTAGFRYYIKEAWQNRVFPYVEKDTIKSVYDLQLNIFGYRMNE